MGRLLSGCKGRLLRRCAYAGALVAVLPGLALLPGLAVAGTHAPVAGTHAGTDPKPGVRNYLFGVKALSPTDAWAVGYYCTARCAGNSQTDQTLIEHWDGTAWTQVPSPNPSATLDQLFAVTATSPTDAWAVGYACLSNCDQVTEADQTLTLHWDGATWSQVASPSPGTGINHLTAVTATSPTDAWAVGFDCPAGCHDTSTLTEHWDGTAWAKVRSPNPGPRGNTGNVLFGTSATAAGDAWASGSYCSANCGTPSQKFRNLIEHWNGTAWAKSTVPTPRGDPNLFTVSAHSPTDAWAVGWVNTNGGASKSMALHWDGTAWAQVTTPNPGNPALLYGVDALSATDAWAAGQYLSGTVFQWHTLLLRWNGTAWAKVSSPAPGPAPPGDQGRLLSQVSADSATDAWAVGSYCTSKCADNGETDHTLILHWNGRRWLVS